MLLHKMVAALPPMAGEDEEKIIICTWDNNWQLSIKDLSL